MRDEDELQALLGQTVGEVAGLTSKYLGERCPNNWHCKDNHTCVTGGHRKLTPEELEADRAAHRNVRVYDADEVDTLLADL